MTYETLFAVIVDLIVLIAFYKTKLKEYTQNKNKLLRLVRSFNLNQIKCLHQYNIINSNSLDLNDMKKLFNDAKTNNRILHDCLGSHESLEEIVNVDKKIRFFKTIRNILFIILILLFSITIYTF